MPHNYAVGGQVSEYIVGMGPYKYSSEVAFSQGPNNPPSVNSVGQIIINLP